MVTSLAAQVAVVHNVQREVIQLLLRSAAPPLLRRQRQTPKFFREIALGGEYFQKRKEISGKDSFFMRLNLCFM